MNRDNVNQLIQLVLKGEILAAFDQFYAENVSMQENNNPPTVGKAANRVRETEFLGAIAEVHENASTFSVVEGDHAVIGWVLDFTNKEGTRLKLDQVAIQTWENG
ncbi:MAG: SnoaL-like domain-containing protein, partial [Fimbriimonas sp.]